MLAVRHIQCPEHCELLLPCTGRTPDSVVETALAQLRFTLRICANIREVSLEQLNDLHASREGFCERCGSNEFQVVPGGVVFGKFTVRRAGEPADREIKAWRAKLPFVVSIRRKVRHPEFT